MKLTVGWPVTGSRPTCAFLISVPFRPDLLVQDRVALQLVQAVGVLVENAAQHVTLGNDGQHARCP